MRTHATKTKNKPTETAHAGREGGADGKQGKTLTKNVVHSSDIPFHRSSITTVHALDLSGEIDTYIPNLYDMYDLYDLAHAAGWETCTTCMIYRYS